MQGGDHLKDRIKAVRKHYHLTQAEFGDRISVKQATVAAWENNVRSPLDSAITLICREFSVNEHWLRTGEGPMIREQDKEIALMKWVATVQEDEPDSFRKCCMNVLMNFTPEDWKIAEKFALMLLPKLHDITPPNTGESPKE